MAAAVIDKAIRRNDFSKNALAEYDADWRTYIGIKWDIDLKMAEKMYGDFNDGQWKKIMDFLSLLSPDEFFDMTFRYKYSRAIKFGRLAKSRAITTPKTLLASFAVGITAPTATKVPVKSVKPPIKRRRPMNIGAT